MTTTTGVAPRISIDAPPPRPPVRSLTRSPGAATLAPDTQRWQGGARLYPFPDAMPDSIDPCASGTFREKLVPEPVEIPEPFPSFTAYLGEICHSPGVGDWPTFQSRANMALEARTSWALERQLAWGAFDDTGPFLADADMEAPAGNSAVAAQVALAWLEGFLAKRGQQGVIHLTPEVATYLGPNTLTVDSNGQVRTLSGTPVIPGAGYSDQAGDDNLVPGSAGAAEAGAGQSWIFASSPVMYRMSDVIALPETLAEALDRSDNSVVYRAERDLFVAFDGGPHAGVLADWSP